MNRRARRSRKRPKRNCGSSAAGCPRTSSRARANGRSSGSCASVSSCQSWRSCDVALAALKTAAPLQGRRPGLSGPASVDAMLTPGQTHSLTIDKPAAGGRMIARVDGQVVLVAGAIPGERVRARIERVGKGVVFADTIAVEEASPDRRDPFADPLCGGNLFGHIAYRRQLEIKSLVIADAFARIGHVTLPDPVAVAASPEEGYRMRARLHVRGHRIGFFCEGTHQLCEVRPTRQLLPATCDTLDRVGAAIESHGIQDIHEIELSENVEASGRVVHLDTVQRLDRCLLEKISSVDGLTEGPFVEEALAIGDASLKFRRHVLAFFQGNRYLLKRLVASVIERVAVGTSLLDLYAGAGLFSVAAAVLRGAWVVAVEGDKIAADDL